MKKRIRYIIFQDKFEYTIDSPLSAPERNASTTIGRNYEKFLKDDKNASDEIMLTYMEPNVEISLEDYKTTKTMLDAISVAHGTAFELHVQSLIKSNFGAKNERVKFCSWAYEMIMLAKELVAMVIPFLVSYKYLPFYIVFLILGNLL